MTSKLIAIASALVATAAIATAADAGGGVRLGFGGPLGTFVATPSHGGGSGGGAYHKPAKRKAPVVHAARKPDKADKPAKKTPHIAKADTPKEAPKRVASKTKPTATETTKAVTATTTEETPSVTGSSALVQGSIPAEPSTAETPDAPAAEVKTDAAPAKTEQADAAVAAAADQPSDGAEDCKKFIPAVGMTVSVGCDE